MSVLTIAPMSLVSKFPVQARASPFRAGVLNGCRPRRPLAPRCPLLLPSVPCRLLGGLVPFAISLGLGPCHLCAIAHLFCFPAPRVPASAPCDCWPSHGGPIRQRRIDPRTSSTIVLAAMPLAACVVDAAQPACCSSSLPTTASTASARSP
jgi:hypothetical protein